MEVVAIACNNKPNDNTRGSDSTAAGGGGGGLANSRDPLSISHSCLEYLKVRPPRTESC